VWQAEPVEDDGVAATLNPQQETAAAHLHGPCLVLAGAGSGKTRVLMVRIERLLEHANSREICAITFTRAAAREMRGRVEGRIGERIKGMVVTTFHSLGLAICREHPELVGRSTNFSVWDEAQQRTEFRRLYRELWQATDPEDPKKLPRSPRDVLDLVAHLKRERRAMDDLAQQWIATACHPVAAEAVMEYEAMKGAANAMDYDDLLWASTRMLDAHPEVVAQYQERWRFLLVDEYQDTNDLQEHLLGLLGGEEPNLYAVGDEDQAIYGFRGSNVQHILNFTTRYPSAIVLELGANYRSTPQILGAADRLVQHNAQRRNKRLWSERPAGAQVAYLHFANPSYEGGHIAQMIADSIEAGAAPDAHAVLCRTRRQMIPIQHALGAQGVTFITVGAQELWQRADVQLCLMWLKLIVNPLDVVAGMACMARWPRLGAKTMTRWKQLINAGGGAPILSFVPHLLHDKGCGPHTKKGVEIQRFHRVSQEMIDLARQGAGVGSLVRWLYDAAGLTAEIDEQRNSSGAAGREGSSRNELKQDFLELCPLTIPPGESVHEHLQAFLDTMLLNSKKEDEEPRVVISTIHGAKGLEWDAVWVPGLVEGQLPYFREGQRDEGLGLDGGYVEEERRLAYVAFTRARDQLVLSSYEQSREAEKPVFVQRSRFLVEAGFLDEESAVG
jgi:DNA helicase-2/ATP-dependent DNA helicase PcrA